MSTSVTTTSAAASLAIQSGQQSDNEGPSLEPLELAEDVGEENIEFLTGRKLALVVMAAGSALVVSGLDYSILATAVPSITNEFKTIADVGWYFSAYRLTSCAFQFMFGKLYTVYSIKVVFLTALVIFEAGSLISGLAQNSPTFVVGRAVSGIGGAGIISGVFTMLRHSVPLHKRPIVASIAAGVEGIAETIAPVLGGVITDQISWRWCFLINPPIGLLTFAGIFSFFQDPHVNTDVSLSFKTKINRLDLFGTAIFVPAVTALLLALQWGGTKYGWGNARIILLFCVCAILLSLFIWHQWRRKDNATLPFRIVGNRSILSGMIFSFCNSSAMSIVVYYMPIYLQSVKEETASKSGLMILPLVISQFVSLCVGGPTISLLGYYVPSMLLTSILTPIAAGLLTTLQIDVSLAQLIAYQAFLGAGIGIGWQGPQIAAQTIMRADDAAMGIACIMFAQHFGPAVFVSVAQTIFAQRLAADLARLAPELALKGGKGGTAEALGKIGLADLKKYLGPKDLHKALVGYDKAITQTFYLPLALTCLTIVGSGAMEWRSVKKKQH